MFPDHTVNKVQQSITQATASLSLRAQFNDRIFHKFLSGRIVFLYGTSNAGKSSIANYLKTKATNIGLNLAITGTDAIWELHIFDIYLQESPDKARVLLAYFSLQEIFSCVWSKNLLSNLIKSKSIHSVFEQLIRNIFDDFRTKQNDLMKSLSLDKRPFYCSSSFIPALELGKLVLVDTAAGAGDIDEFFQAMEAQLIHCRTDVVIVYCSPKQLMSRLYSRNQQALSTYSLNNARPGAFPLTQYASMYEKTNLRDKSVDCIDISDTQVPHDLPGICKTLTELLVEEIGPSIGDYDDAQWTEAENRMKSVFGINSPTDKAFVKPKVPHQFSVNTGEENNTICGDRIINTLRLC